MNILAPPVPAAAAAVPPASPPSFWTETMMTPAAVARSPVLDVPTPPVQSLDEAETLDPTSNIPTEILFHLRSKAVSDKNFSVLLLRHLFTEAELTGRNVRGIGGKLPLDPLKLDAIRSLVFKYYPASSSEKPVLWGNCRKAIDSSLRRKKAAR